MASTTLTPTSATAETPKLKKGSISEAKTPITPTQTSFACPHVKALLTAARGPATEGYTRVIESLRRESNVCGKTHKTGTGADTTGKTTYICLQCSTVSNVRERHRKDHPFAIESNNGFIFCHDCNDYVYDTTFEEIRTSNASKKRKHGAIPADERKLVAVHTGNTGCAATGLRGLYNMGQTCFMSVVLQSLIHNPLIRSFYLTDGHRSQDCEREACTSCALDAMFEDFYGQEKHEGYGAVHMLQGCWKGGGGLAGYSQQDAHEYLGFILNSLHTANTEDDEDEGKKKEGKDCDCMIHQTFGGLYKSTVTCSSCKNVTSTVDPFMDLSLDVRNSNVVIKKKKMPLTNSVQTVKEVQPMDLTECLDRFTSAETLGSDSEYKCRKCDSSEGAKKKLSLSRLPPVIPIHLKRFSHSRTLKESSKVDTRIRFPFYLDFAPYLSTSKKKGLAALANRADGKHTDEEGNVTEYTISEPQYELSSVVVHKGKIDNGHYVSYSKQGKEWFRFDDSMVVQVDEKEVLGAEAYMLFYVVKGFDVPAS
ncbi:cysteine proteinase [Teratosphaeria nubilosa]|uniref:Ubiquitin carboxyl-terminal hydrolase n=1 Tax=Teratosphaeria nubilosa TaxID=161662 RepID=A0A6G1L8Z9_9PEZI|nr:cysteine proteinase [Teratosphaeria nubilosa]